jgi:ribonuclease P protein component
MASPLHLRSGCFELRYRRNAAGGELGIRARLGLVIPKRLARQAVLRNQLKRLAREAFRHALPSLASVDVVLRLSKPALIANGKSGSEERRRWRSDIDGLLAGMRK